MVPAAANSVVNISTASHTRSRWRGPKAVPLPRRLTFRYASRLRMSCASTTWRYSWARKCSGHGSVSRRHTRRQTCRSSTSLTGAGTRPARARTVRLAKALTVATSTRVVASRRRGVAPGSHAEAAPRALVYVESRIRLAAPTPPSPRSRYGPAVARSARLRRSGPGSPRRHPRTQTTDPRTASPIGSCPPKHFKVSRLSIIRQ